MINALQTQASTSRKEILATIRLAHHFDSAFSREQAYAFLRIPMPRKEFDRLLKEMISAGIVFENDGLFFRNAVQSRNQRRSWSKVHFQRFRPQLETLLGIPGIRFAALTGANAFESCLEKDDVDLFFITAPRRLWITYLTLVLFTKWKGLRPTICINYLVDEENLYLDQQDYFTAVQIYQMIPLCHAQLGLRLLDANPWIFKFLPNATHSINQQQQYYLRKHGNNWPILLNPFWDSINLLIAKFYHKRLSAKYPEAIGKGLQLRSGLAKLNRNDHRDIYQEIYRKIDREMAGEFNH